MMSLSAILREALARSEPAILVRVVRAEGSTPRDTDAAMLVLRDASHGTIGGGQLEFHAIDVAREMIASGELKKRLDLPLGPHLGQCCGGRVELDLVRADQASLAHLVLAEEREASAKPHVLLFGAGHVGLALSHSLALLPLAVELIDDRETPPPPLPEAIAFLRMDDPEEAVTQAPAGAAFVILTHSHALDYRLAAAALARADASYVGMIGSATKRARFERWFLARGGDRQALARFACPIGAKAIRDKRPEVIAALATAEILEHLLSGRAASEGSQDPGRTIEGARVEGARFGRHRSAA
jgi:xanthine dehydrogenase accessory protein XdhC